MSTQTKKIGIIEILKNMFASEPDIENYDDIALPEELKEAQKALEAREKEVERGFNSQPKAANNSGFGKKFDPKTEEAMRAMHSKVVEKGNKQKGREIGE